MQRPRLRSQVLPVERLTREDARRLFTLFAAHYQAVEWPRFESDLREKDYVILLLDSRTGAVRGFSTQLLLRAEISGRPVRAIFSGDTIIDRAHWGEQELVRSWCRFAGKVSAEEPATPLYWLLTCKGYRTYLYLPIFFRQYWPGFDAPTPDPAREVLDGLARRLFGEAYRSAAGLLQFPRSLGHLTPELADIPNGRREDPRVRFFLERNPRYREGTELVCLTDVHAGNMRGLALRSFMEGAGSALVAV